MTSVGTKDSIQKVAVVTGGSRGIGRGCVERLAEMGYAVHFNYNRNEEAAALVEKGLSVQGFRVLSRQVDVTHFDQVKTWIADIRQEEGRIDVLVNNAGIIRDKALMLMSQDDWLRVIDTNLNGLFNVSRACIVTFLKQKSGDIINISSISGIVGMPRQSNYSASKGGMNAFTRSLAREVAGYGVRVNGICPGFIETDILNDFSDKDKQEIAARIPLQRIGAVEDVVRCMVFLLSAQSRYIIGQNLVVDGGLSL